MADSESKPLLTDITNPKFLASQGKVSTEVDITLKIKAIIAVLLVPLLLVLGPLVFLINFIKGKFVPKDTSKQQQQQTFPIFTADNNIPYNTRKYDLVMFGATGFTGTLCVEYIIEQYFLTNNNGQFTFAIAGRNKQALERVLSTSLSKIISNTTLRQELTTKIDIIIADSNNIEQLRTMVSNTKSIITTAGPFDKYGTNLVAMCACYGTHLSDITGESDWVRKMIDNYELQASKTGAILTSHAGHDCIPWDLACYNTAQILKEKGENVVKFEAYDTINGNISGGTLATIIHSLQGRTQYKSKLGFDPMVSYFGEKRNNDLKAIPQNFLTYSKSQSKFIGPFVMANVIANCLKRSCSVNKYSADGQKATYKEMFQYSSIWDGLFSFISLIAFGIGLFTPGVSNILSSVLPPGNGPSEDEQKNGYLLIQIIATGTKGTKAESWCYIPKDPGYYYTARMLVETGLVPILNANELSTLPNYNHEKGHIGGYWTPAAGTGPLIQQRLEKIGIVFVTRIMKESTQIAKPVQNKNNNIDQE